MDSVRNNASGTRVPNENYAREVLELYSVGVDTIYNQPDISELAVALAGWSFTVDPADVSAEPGNTNNRRIAKGTFAVYDGRATPAGHLRWDLGGENQANLPNMRRNPGTAPSLTFLGGSFQAEVPPAGMEKGEELIRAILSKPTEATIKQSARFLAARLLRHFVTTQFTQADVDDLAGLIYTAGYDMRAIMKLLLKSNYFYANQLGLVEGPVSWAVRAARLLGYDLAGATAAAGRFPSWVLATPYFDDMGMRLLDPNGPNGWKEDVAWLSSNTYRYRTKLAAAVALAETADQNGTPVTLFPSSPDAWFPTPPTSPSQVYDRLKALLQPGLIPSAVAASWLSALWPGAWGNWNDADKASARRLAFLILCSPGGQLY
ncbi:MAG: DUF1800 family protein [Anaeromyxobacteraceae bacterium]